MTPTGPTAPTSTLVIMASRGGPRAAGTDGTDFSSREVIKEQYFVSATNKSRFRATYAVHVALFFAMVVRMAPELLAYLGLGDLRKALLAVMEEPPKVEVWEAAWLVSFLFGLMGFMSCKKLVVFPPKKEI